MLEDLGEYEYEQIRQSIKEYEITVEKIEETYTTERARLLQTLHYKKDVRAASVTGKTDAVQS